MKASKEFEKEVSKICRHLEGVEREYAKKNIEHRIREDWGYAYATGKMVALLQVASRMKIPVRLSMPFYRRAMAMGLKVKKK